MPQIESPEIYIDGQQVTATRLNNQTNGAILKPGAITEQTSLAANTVATGDRLLIHDASASALRSATASDLLGSGVPIVTQSVTGVTSADLVITPDSGQKVQVVGETEIVGETTVTGDFTATGDTTLDASLTVNGDVEFTATSAVKIPTGTTAQRPGTPVLGQIRYNTTTNNTEIYNGSQWEEVGGGPFDGTGGNQLITVEATTTSATFTSANGESVTVTSAGHTVVEGQVVRIDTAVPGYSGDWKVTSVASGSFVFVMSTIATPNSGSCTYRKAGNRKIHIFTSSGSFVVGSKSGHAEVLVVGGGGGGAVGSTAKGGGGGGAVVHDPYYPLNQGDTISVTVGGGGAAGAPGTSSVFGSITAGGGAAGSTWNGGASGLGSLGFASNAGGGGAQFGAGGGGGALNAGSAASNASSSTSAIGGWGGMGYGSNVSGMMNNYGGGGGGNATGNAGQARGWGGGNGVYYTNNGTPASANTGGGGGGGAAGGSGIVIVSYPYWV